MRIAFASYEFPPETGGGGIGTYLQTATRLLRERGHEAIVFAGTNRTEAFWESEGVYRIPSSNWKDFDARLPQYFLPVHATNPFDVVEGTDFEACGLSLKKALPHLPLVVRLHTPLYMVDRLLYQPMPLKQKLRFAGGALLRGRWSSFPHPPHAASYLHEFEIVERAEVVSSPGTSIAAEMEALGFALANKTEVVPLPFDSKEIEAAAQGEKTGSHPLQVVFIGRMETRKGVIDLADAIPLVLKQHPTAQFTFVGGASLSPEAGVDMIAYLKKKLASFAASVSFSGRVPRAQVLDYLRKGDAFVFPSHYESFGMVCCEAMAAGKPVIGSKNGGMAEIIEDGRSGLLAEPKHPVGLAQLITRLLADASLRKRLGEAAALRISTFLNPEIIIEKQLSCYRNAIQKVKQPYPLTGYTNVFWDEASAYTLQQVNERLYIMALFSALQEQMGEQFKALRFFIFFSHDSTALPASAAAAGDDKVLLWYSDESGVFPEHLQKNYRFIFKSYLHSEKENVYSNGIGYINEFAGQQHQATDKDIDIFFAGNLNAYRLPLYRLLLEEKYPISKLLRLLPERMARRVLRAISKKLTNLNQRGSVFLFSNGFKSGLAYPEYYQYLLRSRFVLCPPGFHSHETFRHLEALHAGCIVISAPMPHTSLYRGHPFLTYRSLQELRLIMKGVKKGGLNETELQQSHQAFYKKQLSVSAIAQRLTGICQQPAVSHIVATVEV